MQKVNSFLKKPSLWLVVAFNTLVALDAYFMVGIMPYIVVASVVAVLIFIGLNKIKASDYGIWIYGLGLAMLWQTSMLGRYVVGSDIHGELWASTVALQNGWNPLWREANNTSIVVGLIVPWISRLTALNLIMVYKLVLPAIFALAPLILFWAFRKQMPVKGAFFAAMFFIIMPVFTLEITAIGKSMVAEVFLALMVYSLVTPWRLKWKVPAVLGSVIMAMFCHYTVGIMAIGYLLGILIFRSVTSPMKFWKVWQSSKFPHWALALCFAAALFIGFIYYDTVGDGYIVGMVKHIGNTYKILAQRLFDKVGMLGIVSPSSSLSPPPLPSSPLPSAPSVRLYPSYLETQPLLVQAGIGLDFVKSSLLGKIFRIVQYATEFLIVVGFFNVLIAWKRYKFTSEFMAGIATSFVLLLFCIFIPAFASLINMTRDYHMSLFFLAPMFVLGCEAIGSITIPWGKKHD
jgi:uncharacterized membrane protein